MSGAKAAIVAERGGAGSSSREESGADRALLRHRAWQPDDGAINSAIADPSLVMDMRHEQ